MQINVEKLDCILYYLPQTMWPLWGKVFTFNTSFIKWPERCPAGKRTFFLSFLNFVIRVHLTASLLFSVFYYHTVVTALQLILTSSCQHLCRFFQYYCWHGYFSLLILTSKYDSSSPGILKSHLIKLMDSFFLESWSHLSLLHWALFAFVQKKKKVNNYF